MIAAVSRNDRTEERTRPAKEQGRLRSGIRWIRRRIATWSAIERREEKERNALATLVLIVAAGAVAVEGVIVAEVLVEVVVEASGVAVAGARNPWGDSEDR